MDERYFLVVHCLGDKNSDGLFVMPLSTRPGSEVRVGELQGDWPCLKHNKGSDIMAEKPKGRQHASESVLIGLSVFGDIEVLKEIACRQAAPIFGIKGKERVV